MFIISQQKNPLGLLRGDSLCFVIKTVFKSVIANFILCPHLKQPDFQANFNRSSHNEIEILSAKACIFKVFQLYEQKKTPKSFDFEV